SLRFVVHGTRADRVHVAPVALLLWMLQRISVTFRSRSKKESGSVLLCQFEQIEDTNRSDLQSLNSMLHVINRTCRRGEIQYVVNMSRIKLGTDILLDKLKSRLPLQAFEIMQLPGNAISDAKNRRSPVHHTGAYIP